ncbi:MAG TPA: 50S ribosomal protein L31 [Candidatus Azoamicus sp. OHIO2]
MKKNIHPKVFNVNINCNCGNHFDLNLTVEIKNLNIEVCNKCHPFYTGKQKIIDVAKRVDKFYKKFSKLQ